jgi:hypothetical protein
MSCIYYVFVNYLLIKVIEYPIVLCLCDRHLFFTCGCGINTTLLTLLYFTLPVSICWCSLISTVLSVDAERPLNFYLSVGAQ